MTDASEGAGSQPPRPFPHRHQVLAAVLALSLALGGWWGVRLWQLRSSVSQYRSFWSVARGEAGGILYVALGDSTAQGIGASGPERGYVGLLAQRLRSTTGRPVQVLNLSRSGARVHDVVIEQLPRLAGLAPDVVTVAVGSNDIKQYDATRFRADFDALVAGLPPGTVVGDVPWFMHGGTGRKSGEAADYVAARAGSRDLPVARLHRAMRERGWKSMFTDFSADWFHPNDRGHRVWADAFWTAINRAGPGQARRSSRLPGR
ncbi:MAG: SGNH/GDSL hydrolase family protein [Actinomycetota bacterium]